MINMILKIFLLKINKYYEIPQYFPYTTSVLLGNDAISHFLHSSSFIYIVVSLRKHGGQPSCFCGVISQKHFHVSIRDAPQHFHVSLSFVCGVFCGVFIWRATQKHILPLWLPGTEWQISLILRVSASFWISNILLTQRHLVTISGIKII